VRHNPFQVDVGPRTRGGDTVPRGDQAGLIVPRPPPDRRLKDGAPEDGWPRSRDHRQRQRRGGGCLGRQQAGSGKRWSHLLQGDRVAVVISRRARVHQDEADLRGSYGEAGGDQQ